MDRLLLRVTEAAELAGLGRSKAYELVNTGEWQCVRIGRCVRISYAWLRGWVGRQVEEAERDAGTLVD